MKDHMQQLPPPPIFHEPTPPKKLPKSDRALTTYPRDPDDTCNAVRYVRQEKARNKLSSSLKGDHNEETPGPTPIT
jgi:hypothetical protein